MRSFLRSPNNAMSCAETYARFKNKAAYEAHNDTDHFKRMGKMAEEEGLMAKPIEIKVLSALAGFASR